MVDVIKVLILDNRKLKILFAFIFVLQGAPCLSHSQSCHMERNVMVPEGNLGQTGKFPWVGVLRTHVHRGSNFKVALTGIILIAYNYAIGYAQDIAKIPIGILKHESKVMFISDDEPWYTNVLGSILHPEYAFTTYNTIALLELNVKDKNPVGTICLPKQVYNTTELYAIGFTDENMLLEKIFYRMQNLNKTSCEDFYKREDKAAGQLASPLHFQCAYASANRKHCGWETGVVLATNFSGVWMLLGFGLLSPGCSAPTRFISLFPYIPWIQESIEVKDMDEDAYAVQY